MPVDANDVDKSLLKKNNVKAAFSAKVRRLWKFASRCSQTVLKHLRLLLHYLLTLAGIAVIVTFSLAPTSGLYQAYREAQWRTAEDARRVEKLRVEGTYHIMEWSYVCSALDVGGQTFTYNISCHSYAMKSNSSLYKDVDCTRSTGTNAEGIFMLLQGTNCTKSNATMRSGCSDCPSPRGFEYPWIFVAVYVGVNLLCVYHCVKAVCKFHQYRTELLHEDGEGTHELRAGILSRAWCFYFGAAFVSISLDAIVLFVVMDQLGLYFLPYMFCFVSFMWICGSNHDIIDETRFVYGLPDSVFAGGKTNEAKVKQLRDEREKKRTLQRMNCRLCGRR